MGLGRVRGRVRVEQEGKWKKPKTHQRVTDTRQGSDKPSEERQDKTRQGNHKTRRDTPIATQDNRKTET